MQTQRPMPLGTGLAILRTLNIRVTKRSCYELGLSLFGRFRAAGGGGGATDVLCCVVGGAGSLTPLMPSLNPFSPSPSPLPELWQPLGAKQQKRHNRQHNQVPWL